MKDFDKMPLKECIDHKRHLIFRMNRMANRTTDEEFFQRQKDFDDFTDLLWRKYESARTSNTIR
jgi:hypothetical protein